jgi:hypothetical protein
MGVLNVQRCNCCFSNNNTEYKYKLLCHKIRNCVELSNFDIDYILKLPNDKKTQIIRLFEECVKNLITCILDE